MLYNILLLVVIFLQFHPIFQHKSQISDYDWDHLAKLTKDSLANASKILTKVQELEQQTHRLVSRASYILTPCITIDVRYSYQLQDI
jgi:hypothetical protein